MVHGLETLNASKRNCCYTGSVTNHQFSRVAFIMCDGEMVRREIDQHLYSYATKHA